MQGIDNLPEHLPGEPPLPNRSVAGLAWVLFTQLLSLAWRSALLLPLWPLYLASRLALPRPPHVASLGRVLHLLGLIFTEQPPAPGLRWSQRALLALSVLRGFALSPLRGLAWHLDELLYGRALSAVVIRAPLFELSAARSGSTQIAHYLEDDPQIVAPSALQTEHPYLWLWRIWDAVIGPLLSPARVRALVDGMYPPEFVARHELDPFRTDTFEIQFVHAQLTSVTMCMGPQAMLGEMNHARTSPDAESLWNEDFLGYVDGIGRKRLLLAELRARSQPPAAAPRPAVRLMIKGHFLNVAAELAERYPDARFLTVIRDPHKRLQSVINFHRVQPLPPGVDPPRWGWIVRRALAVEIEYCEREMEWFQKPEGPHRTVVRFEDYVRDLSGTMHHVYRSCLGLPEPPPHVPRRHAARERSNYAIDRSLEQLGIDPAWLAERLRPYFLWCRGESA